MVNTGRKIIEVSELVAKSLLDNLSPEEQGQLEDWLAESGRNRQLFNEICEEPGNAMPACQRGKEQVESAFRRFVAERNRREKRFRIASLLKYAALFILPLLVGAGIWWFYTEESQESVQVAGISFLNAGNKPVLTLGDGREVVVDRNNPVLADLQGVQFFSPDSAELVYPGDAVKGSSMQYHTLTTPRQCDYHFILSDGTKVWINAESSLRYPVVFAKDERTIYASGEIYLEVAKDSSRPFYVVTNDLKVEVLGTSFNVNAYENEDFATVTLVEGKVAAYTDTGSVQLLPDQQLSLDCRNHRYRINRVDAGEVVAWREGLYIFKGQVLEEVARVLERWYGVSIVFGQPAYKEIVYTGIIKKEDSLEKFIHTLNKISQFTCRLEGDKLYIN